MKTKIAELKINGGVRACVILERIKVDETNETIYRVNVAKGWGFESLWVKEERLSEIKVVSPKELTNAFLVGDKVYNFALTTDEIERGWYEPYGLSGVVVECTSCDVPFPYKVKFTDGTVRRVNEATIKKQ